MHTSASQRGQIYIPRMNNILMVCVLFLVLTFGSSANLATAYGIAVTGEMIVTTILAFIVYRYLWKWSLGFGMSVFLPLLIIEIFLLVANMTKFFEGGYLPISVALLLVTAMITWVHGSAIVQRKSRDSSVPLSTLIGSLKDSTHVAHVPGTAMFLTAEAVVAPPALLHNLKHNGVLHAQNVIVTVATADRPHLAPDEMVSVEPLEDGFVRARLTFGYMDTPNVPRALAGARKQGIKFDIMTTSFFLNRRTYKLSDKHNLWPWQKRLFVALTKTASDAHDYYHLPSGRVIELGQQITL
jgi:KUP system potassium uptake protein